MDSTIQIPGYRIEAEIGKGGMSTVYVAIQESLARKVALKIMAPITTADPSAKERFLKEGKIVARLNHPNIVTVYDFGHVGALYYMAMEYFEGENLNERIRQGLSADNSYDIARQIAMALAYAHNRGFIHRDVKPANILFKEDGTAVLSDFGIAKAIGSETALTGIGRTIGTPDYMSPEQVTGSSLDSRSDLYSLGVVIFEMLTGQKPFKGKGAFDIARSHVAAPVPRLPEHLAVYQTLVDRLLAKKPDERFSIAEQLIHTLDDLFADRESGDSATVIAAPESGTVAGSGVKESVLAGLDPRSRSLGWVVLLVVLVIATGVAIYYWRTMYRIHPQTQMIINMLLSHAELQMTDSHLMEPPGANAYQSYRNVLNIDPYNEQALEGLEKIADHFQTQALSKQQREQFEEGLALAGRGLKVDPRHSGLLALKKKLTAQLEEKRRWRKVTELLTKAGRQLDASRLLEPPGDNAYESFRAVLELDFWNKQALTGLWEIAERLEKQSIGKQRQGLLEEGLELITKGLQISPQHRGLITLEKELKQQLKEKRHRHRMAELLTQAKHQLNTSRLTEPVGDNAHESYRQVLKLVPSNAEAQAGLVQIATRFEELARQHLDKGALQKSLAAVEQGLQVLPGHESLQALRAQLEGRMAEEVRRLAEEQRRQREVKRLLAEAKGQLESSRWTEPEGDNAYTSYRQVLKLAPGNAEAQAGLVQIATRFEELARQHRGEGALQESLVAIGQGLQVLPGHESLQVLRTQLEGQMAEEARRLAEEQRRQREVKRLLAEAKGQLEASRWTEPEGDNAYTSYRKVLKLTPGNAEAQAGLVQIATRFEELARQHLDKGALQMSLTAVEQGLQVLPRHEGLQTLRSEVLGQVKKFERRQQEVQSLLAKAERQLKASRLTRPERDNAYASYRKVLELEPDNAKAHAGLAQISTRFEELARLHQGEGALTESLAAAEQGLQVLSEHAGLQALRAEVLGQLEEHARRRRQVEGLLAQAVSQLADSRLIEPPEDNAYASYRKVLELDADNAEAQAGLKKIATLFERSVAQRRDESMYQESLALAERGLQAFPGHVGLQALSSDVRTKIEKLERRRQEVKHLLAKAERQFKALRLTRPEHNNAYASYRKVLELEPDNAKAQAGLAQIATRYEQIARGHEREGALQESLDTVDLGLQVLPGHTALLALRVQLEGMMEEQARRRAQQQRRQRAVKRLLAEAERQLEVSRRAQQQRRQRAVKRLLAEAERQLKASRWTEPKGDNAYASYRKVLEWEPGNAEAQAGLAQLAARLEELARLHQSEGALSESLAAAEQGLRVMPEHAGLQALCAELQGQLKELE